MIWVYQFTDDPNLVYARLKSELLANGWKFAPEYPEGFLSLTRGDREMATFERRKKGWRGVDPLITCQITINEQPTWLFGIWESVKYRLRL